MISLKDEWPKIKEISDAHGVDALFILAIRLSENGGPGREFGIIDEKAVSYDLQLAECVKTIRGYLATLDKTPAQMLSLATTKAGFMRLCYSPVLIDYVSRKYSPIGAANDPEGLNRNWLKNVSQHYKALVESNFSG